MNEITPTQHTGKAVDARSTKEFPTVAEATIFFVKVREKLRSISEWSRIAGMASFQLTDNAGRDIDDRAPLKGDYLKISTPGPGNAAGGGFDWVRVEEIEFNESENFEEFGFRVRPAHNPGKGDGETAHFYSADATSSFVVMRSGTTISAEVHDRNTKTNDESTSAVDILRNKVTGIAGLLGFSKIQWQKLTDGLLEEENHTSRTEETE